jgi:anti-sigma factor RsiW
MITCRELVALLGDYVSDELPAERRHHIDKHMLLCPQCTAYFQSYIAVIQLTRQLPASPVPPGLAQRFSQAAAQQQRIL